MKRCNDLYGQGNGERLDTVEGPYDLYDQEDDDQNEDQQDQKDFDAMQDDDSEEQDSEDDNPDKDLGIVGIQAEGKKKKNKKKNLNASHDKLEVNLDEISDENDQEDLLNYN